MFFVRRPADSRLRLILLEQKERDLSYRPVGGTRDSTLPAGFPHHQHEVRLGHGDALFARACRALREWRMYELGWTELCWPAEPVEGLVVGVLVRHHGLWSFNPCRVVYVVDEAAPVRCYGFAFGTLPAHSESGEERFSVEQGADGTVRYRIRTFARAHGFLATLAPPLVRYYQQRFGRESLAAMRRAVGAG